MYGGRGGCHPGRPPEPRLDPSGLSALVWLGSYPARGQARLLPGGRPAGTRVAGRGRCVAARLRGGGGDVRGDPLAHRARQEHRGGTMTALITVCRSARLTPAAYQFYFAILRTLPQPRGPPAPAH